MTCYCGSCPDCDRAQGLRYCASGDRAECECISCGELIPARYALCDACSLAAESGARVEELEIEENHRMILEFDAATHRYTLNGERVPGVTSITDTLIDFGGIPPSVLEAARDRGTAVHLMCQYVDEGGVDESSLDPALLGYLAAYRGFLADTQIRWSDIEQRVGSRLYRYAGTLDRVGALPQGRKTLRVMVDIKAVAQIQPAVGPQTAAYTQAYRETFPRHPTIQARFALQLKPDGSYKFHECREESDLSVFLAAKTIHEWRARHA